MNLSYKNYCFIFLLSFIFLGINSCTPKKNLVGSDRDKHGCIASAGYKWSEALNDCIRPWEIGERFSANNQSIILVFSKDSNIVEIFSKEKKNIICKRKKSEQRWISSKGNTEVYISGDQILVNYKGMTLHKE